MHELSLCRHIINTIEIQSAKFANARVKNIYLEIGLLAAVEKSALQFNFDILKKGTLLECASLHFLDISGEAICHICQKNVKIIQYQDPCPMCGQFSLTITKGQELRIKSVEVE